MKKKIKLSKKILGAALALGLGTSLNANAISMPQPSDGAEVMLSMTEVPTQPTLLNNEDHQCGDHECGEDGGDDEHDETTPVTE